MKELEYPFDGGYILKKSKSIKKALLSDGTDRIHKKIAVLGGSTTHDIIRILELFLLNYGIEPEFFESEYAMYWQDAMFPENGLLQFEPDIIFIHTSIRNIKDFPLITDTKEEVDARLQGVYSHFEVMWKKLEETFHCPIIQNNFEEPYWRLMGNRDAYDIHGRTRFVRRLNERFADFAESRESFYINDLHYLAGAFGLDEWSQVKYWHLYKYALCTAAIPAFSYSVANIIKSVYGKNKKTLVLDLDNTLWGGVIGDDGQDGIEIGEETGKGQVYKEFQEYIKAQKDIGIILNVSSKNDKDNALAGLNHPDGVLKPDDFLYIAANWEPKSGNIRDIAESMNILPDSVVFVDDNPAEREIVRQQLSSVSVPDIGEAEDYIRIIDRSGFFETTALSSDDLKRADMYKENAKRLELESSFSDYGDYLKSLEMSGEIKPFSELYLSRIAQLTNKSNQFNLTTKRYTREELSEIARDDSYITLYGRLVDKFGDNGIVSLIVAGLGEDRALSKEEIEGEAAKHACYSGSNRGCDERQGDFSGQHSSSSAHSGDSALQSADFYEQGISCSKQRISYSAHILLWLMSCRVLKRDMEYAMMDAFVMKCKALKIKSIYGYYYPTAKNHMVEEFYGLQGFEKIKEDKAGNTVWKFDIADNYENKNKFINVKM